MAKIDLLNLEKTVISTTLEGLKVCIYSNNSLGKTFQSCRFDKPLILSTENGTNGIHGVYKISITKWEDFKSVVNQLTKESTFSQMYERYNTIIIDVADRLAGMCEDYVCSVNGVEKLGDIPYGAGYTFMRKELDRVITKLSLSKYFVIFLAHEMYQERQGIGADGKPEKYIYTLPKDSDKPKSAMKEIINICDVTTRLVSNGIDENNNVILSSAYNAETKEFFARSRFTKMETYIKEFTKENYEKALLEGIAKQAEMFGQQGVSFDQKLETEQKMKTSVSLEEVLDNLKKMMTKLYEVKLNEDVNRLVVKHIGEGRRVSECSEYEIDKLTNLEFALQDLMEDKKVPMA